MTPGLDLIDNFWGLALQDGKDGNIGTSNYELMREKLYFKFVSLDE